MAYDPNTIAGALLGNRPFDNMMGRRTSQAAPTAVAQMANGVASKTPVRAPTMRNLTAADIQPNPPGTANGTAAMTATPPAGVVAGSPIAPADAGAGPAIATPAAPPADPNLAALSPAEQNKVGVANTMKNYAGEIGAGISATQAKVRDAITPWYGKTQTAGAKKEAETLADYAQPQPPAVAAAAPAPAAPVAAGASMTPATDAAKAEIEARTGSGKNTYTPVAANPTALPAAANVSNPGQLQADQARYDQEQAAYKANPVAQVPTQMAQLAAAATPPAAGPAPVATPAGHVFQAGGRLSEAGAAALTAKAAALASDRAQRAQAPIIKGQQEMALAGVNNAAASSLAGQKSAADLANQTQLAKHAQGLKTSDPLYNEQLTSAKGTNASAARVSQLQATLVDKNATPEDKAAAVETLRDLQGKEDQTKIGQYSEVGADGMNTTQNSVIYRNGKAVGTAREDAAALTAKNKPPAVAQQAHIDMLKKNAKNPTYIAAFNAKFGAGAAEKILGVK